MTDRPRPTEYEAPMVIGDDSDYRPEGCTWVAVCIAAVIAGNALGVVNAAAAWNAAYYSNVAWTQNWLPNTPPCSK